MTINLQQALEKLDAGELPFSDSYAAKVRGSVNKCAVVYNCDLLRIPADPVAFVKRWQLFLKNKNFPAPFPRFGSFKDWYDQTKSLIDHVSGERKRRDQLRECQDDWTDLEKIISDLIQEKRKGCGLQQFDLVAVMVLRNFARQNERQPFQLTSGLVAIWMQQATSGQKSSMRTAVSVLNKLHDLDFDFPAGLLPHKIDQIPVITRRRVTPTLPPKCEQAIADLQSDMRLGVLYDDDLLDDDDLSDDDEMRKDPCAESSIKSVRDTVGWFFSCMVELDFLDLNADPDPSTFATIGCITAAFESEVAGEFYWTPLKKRTVRKNLEGTFRFLRRFNPKLKSKQQKFFKQKYFAKWQPMTEENEEFCRSLMKSSQDKAKSLNLGAIFYDKAASMIANYSNLSFNEKTQAQHWALSAAAAAILTFLPLRATNLTQLTIEGEEANVFLPYKSKDVQIVIPKEMVKNNRKIVTRISRRGKTDPRTILLWWLSEARPLIMAGLSKPDVTLLLGGARYQNLYKSWRFATASVDLYMNLHQVRHAIASILKNQPNSDIEVIAALLADEPATVDKIYAFIDIEDKTQQGLNGLADVNCALQKGLKR